MKGYFRYIVLFLLAYNTLSFNDNVICQNLNVIYSGNSSENTQIPTIVKNNIIYISVNDFTNLFNSFLNFNPQNDKIEFSLFGNSIHLTPYNPFIVIDKQVFQLATEIIIENDEYLVPLVFFLEILETTFPNKFIYDKWNNQLEITSFSLCNIVSIDIEEKINGTMLKIHTTRDFLQSELSLRSGHNWLYVDLYGGKVDSTALEERFSRGLISKIVPSQLSNELAQIGFKLRNEAIEKQVMLQSPREILVLIKTRKDISAQITKNLEFEKQKWLIDKIVIDPGHGGKDPGTVGRKYKTYEKNVVLGISHYLKEMLENELNIEVLMTRDDDRFIELEQRTEFANRNEAKLFISIHANSNNSRRAKGVSTYFLGPSKTQEARDVARFENSVITYENNSKYADLSHENFILSAMAQNVYNVESQDLAATVQQEISKGCNLHDLGVFQAGFYVLWGASMPNILIETAFLSNSKEEKLLRTKNFQKKIARSIYRSIEIFKEKYESGL